MNAVLVDTNVLFYAVDGSDARKQAIARQVVQMLELRSAGVVTTQVLAEYYSSVTRKLAHPAPESVAFAGLERYAATMRVLDLRVPVVFEAARAVQRYGLSYYDAQIWASARLEGIDVVLSEDFSPGTAIEGVRFLDPFASGFSMDEALGHTRG
jgi:predicted nucleic acid-binding protein